MSATLNRRRAHRTADEVRDRHLERLIEALLDLGQDSYQANELAQGLYEQGVRVRL